MLFNADAAAASVEHTNAVMRIVAENSPEDPVNALPVHDLLRHLQNVVIHAAALLRYCWPVGKKHQWRGEQLRQAFLISEESALKPRELRNAIEHFDERLDLYVEEGLMGQIIPEYVGPVPESSGVRLDLFRGYYIDTGEFELLGNRFNISKWQAKFFAFAPIFEGWILKVVGSDDPP